MLLGFYCVSTFQALQNNVKTVVQHWAKRHIDSGRSYASQRRNG
jgi:hypothetical protein